MFKIIITSIILYLIYCYGSAMFLTIIGASVLICLLFYSIFVHFSDCNLTLAFAEKFGQPISSLKGKVVFITGASSGIGEYTAYALAKNGVKLVLAARRQNELQRVKEQCIVASQGQLTANDILVLPMDVVNFSLHQKYFTDALNHFGQIDILFNNAGRSQRAVWENIDLSVDKEMFDLNVFAIVNFSRIAVKYFLQKKEGHIVVTSSVTGITGMPFSASYTGAKHALHGYFNSLRQEKLLENITVSMLCPGSIFTHMLENCFTEKQGEKFGQTTKLTDKRMTAERCGNLIALSMANKLEESWLGVPPLLSIMYTAVYTPILFNLYLKIMGPQILYYIRDSKNEFKSVSSTN